jgi:uncharacterized protein with PIN domain
MIAVDTSALMAILLSEPEADSCAGLLEAEPHVLISAGTVAEAMIVAGRRNVKDEMAALIENRCSRFLYPEWVSRPVSMPSTAPEINFSSLTSG